MTLSADSIVWRGDVLGVSDDREGIGQDAEIERRIVTGVGAGGRRAQAESRPEKGAQSPEPGYEEPEVVADRGQNGIDRVAVSTQQAIALNQTVALQVPDH